MWKAHGPDVAPDFVNARAPLGPATWITWLSVALLCLLCILPARVRRALSIMLARVRVHIETGGRHRRRTRNWHTVDVNLRACLPHLDAAGRRALYEAHLSALIGTVMLTPTLWFGSADRIVRQTRFHGLEHLRSAKASGRATVLSISHTVALDMGIMSLSPAHAMHGIYKPFNNPVIDWLVNRSRRRFGGEPVARGVGMRGLIKSLRAGSILCYLSDEDFGAAGSVFAPFFGHQKATLAMLPRITRLTDAVVIPMGAWLSDDHKHIDVRLFEPLANFPVDDEIENARLTNAAIEATVLVEPAQYLWKIRLFRTSPDGGASRYGRIERGEMTPEEL